MSDQVRSYGGAAGEAAVTEDLERGARILVSAAMLLEEAGAELAKAREHADVAARAGSAPTRVAARGASNQLWDAQFGVRGSTVTAVDARDLADRLGRVAREFLLAEEAAMAHVSAATRARLAVGSMWGTGMWLARGGAGVTLAVGSGPLGLTGMMRSVVGWILPDGPPPTTGFLNKDTASMLVSGTSGSLVAYRLQAYTLAAVAAGLEGLFGEGHATTVKERESSYAARRPAGVEDLMIGILDELVRNDGSVSVETITHADGTRSHIVTVPGTEDWGLSNDNPHDLQANLAGVEGGTSDAQSAIVDAMRAAGIKPGEEVMMTGHSQGGINAAALVSRPEFMTEFNVTHLVTAGSPVGRMDLPPSVQVLHMEHGEDIVVGVDGVPNPATPTRTTVERDLLTSEDPSMREYGSTIAGAHYLRAYGSTGGLIDTGQAGASAAVWRESASSFFSGDPSTLTEYVPVVPPPPVIVPVCTAPPPAPLIGPARMMPERLMPPPISGLPLPAPQVPPSAS